MSANQSAVPVVAPLATVTVTLFSCEQHAAGLVEAEGELPTGEILRRALSLVHQYQARHVLANVRREPQPQQA